MTGLAAWNIYRIVRLEFAYKRAGDGTRRTNELTRC